MTGPAVDERRPDARVAALVVNYGSHDLLRRHLAPLSRVMPYLDVVVCDNYSSDTERAAVSALAQQEGWRLIEAANNGFAAGTNLAAQAALAAGATHLLLLNPDAATDAASVDALLAMSRASQSALVAPRFFDEHGRQKGSGRYLRLRDGIMTDVRLQGRLDPAPGLAPWISAACLLVPVGLWQSVQGMSEQYFLYWEDVDFSYRAVAAGAALLICDDAVCVHEQGGTHARSPEASRRKTSTYLYFNARNRLLFAASNLDPQRQREWRLRTPQAAARLIRRTRGRTGALLRPEGAWSAVARGIRDGWAMPTS